MDVHVTIVELIQELFLLPYEDRNRKGVVDFIWDDSLEWPPMGRRNITTIEVKQSEPS